MKECLFIYLFYKKTPMRDFPLIGIGIVYLIWIRTTPDMFRISELEADANFEYQFVCISAVIFNTIARKCCGQTRSNHILCRE